jgi:hypothetical protein
LRLCTPYTIANQINTTVTLFERGAGVVVGQTPMVNPALVGSAIIQNPSTPITVPPRPNNPPPQGAVGPFEVNMSPTQITRIQKALCVKPDGQLGPSTRTAIGDYLVAIGQPRSSVITSRVNSLLQRAILKTQDCTASGFQNATQVGKSVAPPAPPPPQQPANPPPPPSPPPQGKN